MMKHFNEHDDGFPTNHGELETIRESYSHINHLAVKLHVSTKINEKAIMITKFDLQQPDQQKWSVLFHLPASEKTLISELLEKCRDLLSRSYDTHYKLEQLRFRDLTESGAVSLKKSTTLEARGQNQWHRNLYLQILKEEDLAENLEKCVPVMIQRWCPSTLEVMPVFEVHLPLDAPEPSKVLRTLIAKHADLPVERIEISDAFPNIGWMKWPYSKSVLELFDTVKFRGEGALHARLENGYNGKLVYYKDSNEFKRDISEDERKSIRIKENVGSLSYNQSSNLARRKERPLRIQMSSVSESDP
uniref:Ubiquitinyl hydrolase 1 n=1 Tax=Ditylenchus dipsaci TaxID=166011 RepID=A0A915CYI9_9BILA